MQSVREVIVVEGRYDKNALSQVVDAVIVETSGFGIYNDAYWCGYSYFELQQRLKKPFSYLFLKLPLSKMMDIYPIFHEMDFSALLEFFEKEGSNQLLQKLVNADFDEKNFLIVPPGYKIEYTNGPERIIAVPV